MSDCITSTHFVLKAPSTLTKSLKTRKQTDEKRVHKFILNIGYNCT